MAVQELAAECNPAEEVAEHALAEESNPAEAAANHALADKSNLAEAVADVPRAEASEALAEFTRRPGQRHGILAGLCKCQGAATQVEEASIQEMFEPLRPIDHL